MFITEKYESTTKFDFGVRYVIFLTDKYDVCGYEISIEDTITEIRKYPWLTGITMAGKEPFNRQELCLEIFKNLPVHFDIMIVTKKSYDCIRNTKLYNQFSKIILLREDNLDFFIKRYINN